jgi:hypothetical protein
MSPAAGCQNDQFDRKLDFGNVVSHEVSEARNVRAETESLKPEN